MTGLHHAICATALLVMGLQKLKKENVSMYLIIGVRAHQHVLIGTADNAAEALAMFKSAPDDFERIFAQDSLGAEIGRDELHELSAQKAIG